MAFFDWFTGDKPALVVDAFSDMVDMVSRGRYMFVASTGRLLFNEILEEDMEELDDEIDALERHLRSSSLRYVSSSSGKQVVFVLKLLSVVQEAERIGDLAKTLAATADLAHTRRLGPRVGPLREFRDRILEFFDLTLQAFQTDEAALADQVLHRHAELKLDISQYLSELADSEDITANEGIIYALSARMLGRTSSHLANIASIVVFPFEHIRRTQLDDPDSDEMTAEI